MVVCDRFRPILVENERHVLLTILVVIFSQNIRGVFLWEINDKLQNMNFLVVKTYLFLTNCLLIDSAYLFRIPTNFLSLAKCSVRKSWVLLTKSISYFQFNIHRHVVNSLCISERSLSESNKKIYPVIITTRFCKKNLLCCVFYVNDFFFSVWLL